MQLDGTPMEAAVRHLAALDRRPCSDGEREAAEWLASRMAALGVSARVEAEDAHGTYWVPNGILSAIGAGAGLAALARPRSRVVRAAATVAGALAAAGIAEDVSGGPHLVRRLLRRRTTRNVVAEAGDPRADRTILLVAHHDAAPGGVVFNPVLVHRLADHFPSLFTRIRSWPPLLALVAGGPALVAVGAPAGARRLLATGTGLCAGSLAAMVDIGLRRTVPGANDNLTGVAVLLHLARALRERPPAGARVILLSTGAEESFMEGMRGFLRRHRDELAPDRTHVLVLDTVGSPRLVLIEGEGMLRMNGYPEDVKRLVAECAEREGVELVRGLKLRFATDGLIALMGGYPTAGLGSVDRYKLPANYHSPTDVPENVVWETVHDAARLSEAFVRRVAQEGSAAGS